MPELDIILKNSPTYLDVASNGNGFEKAALTLEAMRRTFELEKESVHIVEVGPGGGSVVNMYADRLVNDTALQDGRIHLSLLELDGVESMSLSSARSELSEAGSESSFHKGNIVDINEIFSEDVDIISASSVLHEVYSYSGGYEAIDTTFRAITKTLSDGGYFAYRDVYGVEGSTQHRRERHIYDRTTWVLFSKLFLEYYLNNATHPYHQYDDRIIFSQQGYKIDLQDSQSDMPLSIEAPVGILRELQRHYITFRDHVWRSGALGIKPDLDSPMSNDWIDKHYGHKRVHFELLAKDTILESISHKIGDNSYVVDGDIFDDTTDVLLAGFLESIDKDAEQSSFWKTWKEWLDREGSETYLYMSLNQLIGSIAARSLEASDGKSILLPTRNGDISRVKRLYYNRYLKYKLSNPLIDAKQLILFEKIPISKTNNSLENNSVSRKLSSALGLISVFCSSETTAGIYSPLRKAMK